MKRVLFRGPTDVLAVGEVLIERGKSELVSDEDAEALRKWPAVQVTVTDEPDGKEK